VTVFGATYQWDKGNPIWDMTTDLAGASEMYNSSEQASTMYHLYITETGDRQISDMYPYYRPDLKGYYHPYNHGAL